MQSAAAMVSTHIACKGIVCLSDILLTAMVDVMQAERSASSSEEDGARQESPRRILAAVQNKPSPSRTWSSKHASCHAHMRSSGHR